MDVGSITGQSTMAATTNTTATKDNGMMMDKEDFLMLFMESLKNQDPMSPMDNNAMMQQLSQLGQMEAIANLKLTVDKMGESLLGNKIADAAALLGKTVVAEDSSGQKVIGTPTAYRLNEGVIEYLINKKVVQIGQIREVGVSEPGFVEEKPNEEKPEEEVPVVDKK